MLKGKKIILGVSGSIAAYKSATLVRLLVKRGAQVQVLMTKAATEFIPALTLATLSQNPVLIQPAEHDEWNNHVSLGKNADLFVIAPASANTLAKLTSGLCDNMLLATYLSAVCPVFIAPAMDLDMWQHPATRTNIKTLLARGNHLIEVEEGELASGLYGAGRMSEPEHIVQELTAFFSTQQVLKGKRTLVTAGPTHEAIDPVRFIGNHSSGKMGFALAEALARQGAKVELVSGPVALQAQHPGIRVHPVETAVEMQKACEEIFPNTDLAILAAAVADYRPAKAVHQKIKKTAEPLTLTLKKNPDILQGLGQQKKEGQLLVGFALETENEEENARQKLKKKNLDLIALNSLRDAGSGFKTDTNKVTLLDKDGGKTVLPLLSKQEVATLIVKHLMALYENKS